MRTMIYCEPSAKGVHSFYLAMDGDEYYLFSQAYRKGVQEYFSRGVSLKEAGNYAKSHNDSAIIRTMNKLPGYIKYLEKEYELEVFEQTKRKNNRNCRRFRECA